MKILITGGGGFIGQHLTKKLQQHSHQVTIADLHPSSQENTLQVDLLNPPANLTAGFDVIIHLASIVSVNQGINNPQKTLQTNFNCTLNLLEDIRKNNPSVLFIFASSDKIYGSPTKPQVSETDKGQPLEPYGHSKALCEALIKTYHNLYHIPYVIFRSGIVFGPHQSPQLFIPYLMTEIAQNNTQIKIGNLTTLRNFIYIDDLTQAYLSCLTNEQALNQTFNFASYVQKISDITTLLTHLTKDLTGRDIEFLSDKNKIRDPSLEPNPFTLDCTKAHQLLNWQPTITFEQALKNTLQSYLPLQ